MKRLLSLLLLVLIATACQPLAHVKRDSTNKFDSSNWQATAKAAVRVDAENSSSGQAIAQSFSMQWHQAEEDYDISLRGAFGVGATRIVSKDNYIEVRKGGDIIARSNDSGALAEQILGIDIPIAALRFWMLGLKTDAEEVYAARAVDDACDGTNTCSLATIHEDGWQVRYPEVMQIGDVVVPKKIEASKQGILLKLLIRDWSSGAANPPQPL